ncbi:putative U3 small nucleolar RNA-associated protein 15-like protein [Monocercomonoides exilis]|uniref:putative U3 small nucleolar RNA-associated protein 15-like protein n=1 Tax=Monocercomonoides exilis TaxID=2049356 RepID=UPI003559ECF3|nr:putative U3 small nucleolar RNA-associated protein 15-like protein [Monocercomonoides exilis]|eukprot:MONOS_1912.1-p1 / transcript=MONOS_1912.1 / gene=MONOS_1912 / organism=Monocercomonoides_exilis_PA203 / gene_product=U3 small nucleolar RNA-associated protein 15-like protein / transcript_product=U3 small nucleolar RNA-associated protein 15-like protein / location=Mono_scaffold00036:141842-144130(+) / protein_length=738 / sequence_SO=supercontig / SO=protein_coding / is_pseudo=false
MSAFPKLVPPYQVKQPNPVLSEASFWTSLGVSAVKKTNSPPISLSFNKAHNDLILSVSASSVDVIDISSMENVFSLNLKNALPRCAVYRPDGKIIVVGTDTGMLLVYNASTRKLLHKIKAHEGPCRVVVFTEDKKKMISGGDDGIIKIFNSETFMILGSAEAHSDYIKSIACNPSCAHIIATASYDRKICLWNLREIDSGEPLCQLDHKDPVESICFLPGGTMLASTAKNKINIWDLLSSPPRVIKTAKSHNKTITSLMLMSRSRSLPADKAVQNLPPLSPDALCSGILPPHLKMHTLEEVFAGSPFRLCSVSLDGIMKIHSLETMQVTASIASPLIAAPASSYPNSTKPVMIRGSIVCAARSSDEKSVVFGFAEGGVAVMKRKGSDSRTEISKRLLEPRKAMELEDLGDEEGAVIGMGEKRKRQERDADGKPIDSWTAMMRSMEQDSAFGEEKAQSSTSASSGASTPSGKSFLSRQSQKKPTVSSDAITVIPDMSDRRLRPSGASATPHGASIFGRGHHHLSLAENLLRNFRHHEALDTAISSPAPGLAEMMFAELSRRGALRKALHGRDPASMAPIVEWLSRNLVGKRMTAASLKKRRSLQNRGKGDDEAIVLDAIGVMETQLADEGDAEGSDESQPTGIDKKGEGKKESISGSKKKDEIAVSLLTSLNQQQPVSISSSLMEAAAIVVDECQQMAGLSVVLDEALVKLRIVVNAEVALQNELLQLSGMIDAVLGPS